MRYLKKPIHLSIVLLICLVGFPQISETIYTPALPAVAEGLSTNMNAVESTLAIYFLGFALGVFVWGAVSDWIGRRPAMLLGIVVYSVSCVLCSGSTSVCLLLFWRFLQAFGASVGSVITQTMLRDIYSGQERAKIFSVMSGALAFSPALGPLMGGYLSEYFGWRSNFTVLVIMGIALFLWAYRSLPETKDPHFRSTGGAQSLDLAVQMFKSKTIWGHVLLIGGTNGILFSFYGEAPSVFIDQLGMRPTLYGLLGILIACGTLVSSRVSYLLASHYTSQFIIQIGAIITCLSSLGFTLIQYLGLFSLSPVGMSLSLSALFFIFVGIGLIIPNSLSSALKDFQSMVGTAGSFFGTAYYLVIAGATWMMSLLHNGTLWPLPLYLTFLSFVLVFGNFLCSVKIVSLTNLTEHSCSDAKKLRYKKNI